MVRKTKDSGVEWIGGIPEHWEVRKLGNIADFYTGNSIKDSEKDKYSNSNNSIPYITTKDVNFDNTINYENGMYIKKSDKTFKRTYIESILICIEGGSAGKKIARLNQEVSFGNKLCSIFSVNLLNKFLYFYILGPSFENSFFSRITGLIPGVNLIDLSEIDLVIPPQNEQEVIANFLDKKTSQIDHIIKKSKESIEKYKRYKESLITEIVTKGLDKNVPMKNSGIEWIGDIPEHWEVMRLKELFRFSSGLTITKADLLDKGFKVINYGEIHSKYKFDLDVNRDRLKSVNEEYKQTKSSALVKKGDFIFCDTSEDIEGSGNCVLIQEDNNDFIFAGSHTVIAKLKIKVHPRYIRYMLSANSIKEQIGAKVVGIKVYSITQAILKEIYGIIPSYQEQEAIANFLDKKTSQIDKIISEKERLIEKLETYKKSLIYEYVTGKKEVKTQK